MSGFIPLGKTSRFLAEKHYTADHGQHALLTDPKLHQHLHVFGLTSSGMTSNWMHEYAAQWLYEQRRDRVLAKRDAHRERMRQERLTAKAMGPSRRQGRL